MSSECKIISQVVYRIYQGTNTTHPLIQLAARLFEVCSCLPSESVGLCRALDTRGGANDALFLNTNTTCYFALVMDIEKLDASTRSRLRSTQILTSLPHIVSELLQNSLDAGSSTIEIGLDAQEWMCWVKDNGHGISKQNLEVIGQENDSGRYATSKAYSQNLMNAETTFGFRGEGQSIIKPSIMRELFPISERHCVALASTCELSCVEISSRTVHSKESYSVIMKVSSRLNGSPECATDEMSNRGENVFTPVHL